METNDCYIDIIHRNDEKASEQNERGDILKPSDEEIVDSQVVSAKPIVLVDGLSNVTKIYIEARKDDEKKRGSENEPIFGNEHCHFKIIWLNISYAIEPRQWNLSVNGASKKYPKQILNDLSGSLKSGQMTAVLGPSGAGKSTFIDCLLGKKSKGLSGKTRVIFDNKNLEIQRRKKRPLKIATISQTSHLLDTLTVKETLMFASRIKNAANLANHFYSKQEGVEAKNTHEKKFFDHEKNVQSVIKSLDLNSCATVRCGKLSGGQYKRVSIAQELLSRPDLMILDEPTSGLDSVACYKTIEVLRDLVESSQYPLAILTVIHQPDIEVMSLIHKVYVLNSEGKAIYEGQTNGIFNTVNEAIIMVEETKSASVSQAELAHLKKIQGRFLNPAKLILELATCKYGSDVSNCLQQLQLRHQRSLIEFKNNLDERKGLISADSIVMVPISKSSSSTLNKKFDMPTTTTTSNRELNLDKLLCLQTSNQSQQRTLAVHIEHIMAHTERSWKTILRDPSLFTLQLALHIIVPLLLSYMFQRHRGDGCPMLGTLDVVEEAYSNGTILDDLHDEMRSSIENIGFLYFEIHAIAFAAACITSLTYPLVMQVLIREYRNGWYSMGSYFIGRTLADIPLPIMNVFIALGMSYYLTGQPSSHYEWRFLSITILTILATLIGQTTGLIFGSLFMNKPASAVFAAPVGTAPLTLVSGFLIRVNSLPYVLKIFAKLSYFTYLMNGVIVSRYGFNKCSCTEDDFNDIEPSHIIPDQARKFINIWIESFSNEFYDDDDNSNGQEIGVDQATAASNNGTTTTAFESIDLVGKLINTISKAKTFGYQMTNCQHVKPYNMLDYELEDSDLLSSYEALIVMMIVMRILAYLVLKWKIRSSF